MGELTLCPFEPSCDKKEAVLRSYHEEHNWETVCGCAICLEVEALLGIRVVPR